MGLKLPRGGCLAVVPQDYLGSGPIHVDSVEYLDHAGRDPHLRRALQSAGEALWVFVPMVNVISAGAVDDRETAENWERVSNRRKTVS